MAKYCCFNCPQKGHDDTKTLASICPECGMKYGFPLEDFPEFIGKFSVIKGIDRGFYGAAYLVEDNFGRKRVLKVIPKKIYKLFEKDFDQECKIHVEASQGTPHVVDILDSFEENIKYGKCDSLDCHIAILAYIEGDKLENVLKSNFEYDASKIAQIAIDLLKILQVFGNKQKSHNDLHFGNILVETLNKETKRGEEVNNFVRAVAIDLGSMSGNSNSRDESGRIGDVHRIAEYLTKLSQRLLKNDVDSRNDNEYRLASLLDDTGRLLMPHIVNQRTINYEDIITDIRYTFFRVTSPWKEPLELRNFNDSYNAQTLAPWHVNSLLVDPDNQWQQEISGKGPKIITGMRGCGKTMLLRSMQFHAKAVPKNDAEKNNNTKIMERLQNDRYVGIYVSSTKLLDKPGKPSVAFPFARLFVSYGIQSLRAVRHLNEINKELVNPGYYQDFLELFKAKINSTGLLEEVYSDYSLEKALIDIQNSLSRGENKFDLNIAPSNAFDELAKVLRNCSSLWNSSYILFLLDDVSTRYLQNNDIIELLSTLIFQSEHCAFKITSEAQTIEILLNSPGNIEKARIGRDYDNFDLGEEVHNKIRGEEGGNSGKNFLQNILSKRAEYHSRHPRLSPKEILGDISLISMAKNICNLEKSQKDKNTIYHGLSALAGVCVGDIGDVISIYDEILNSAEQGSYPVSPEKQSEVYRNISSVRLYVLARRESFLKDFAISFAEAAHELLLQSHRDTPNRLRQYSSIYINITDDLKQQETQFGKLIELIDAGVFVFTGGADSPRMLGNDSNPVKQFVIQYRKLYGITNLIGFQQADRFELKGERLHRWLNNPKDGKKILMEGLGSAKRKKTKQGQRENQIKNKSDKFLKMEPIKATQKLIQHDLFEPTTILDNVIDKQFDELVKQKLPKVQEIPHNVLSQLGIDTIVLGLGFEERTLESAKRILATKPKKAILIEYDVEGRSKEIRRIIEEKVENIKVVSHKDQIKWLEEDHGKVLCDISGLSKQMIFQTVKNKLAHNKEIVIAHTMAKSHYPLDKDIDALFEHDLGEWDYDFLNAISNNLVKGEGPPYEIYQLISKPNIDELKRRILFGFSTSKYEKLLKILDEREYDAIEIVSPTLDNPRSKLAKIAAQLIKQRYNFAHINEFNQYDLHGMIGFLVELYQDYYVNKNFNFELALTGSKRHAVACAVLSAIFKIAQCWYLAPGNWDTERFSKGVGGTTYFHISIDKIG